MMYKHRIAIVVLSFLHFGDYNGNNNNNNIVFCWRELFVFYF